MGQFQGFGPKALKFFEALAFHQNRDWFLENKPLYESEVLHPMQALVTDLVAELAERGVPLTGDPKRSIFRLHRDVRFSKNKEPYKTNTGASLTRHGTKMSPGMLYVHVAPDGCFAALAFYRPEPEVLAALRGAIAAAPARWLKLEAELKAKGLVLSGMDALTRLPRGFDPVALAPVAEALKQRSYVIRQPLAAEALFGPGLVEQIADFAEAGRPFLDFGWSAIDHARGAAAT